MKTIIMLAVAILCGGFLYAQKLKEQEVPVSVRNAFKSRFPNAVNVKWSKENRTEFEAEFTSGQLSQAANFDVSGRWLVTETEIKKTDLPAAVSATLEKEFGGYKINEIEKVETPGQPLFYEFELKKDRRSVGVQISSEGNVLKTE